MPTERDPTGYWPSKYKYDFYKTTFAVRRTGWNGYGGRVRDTARDNPR